MATKGPVQIPANTSLTPGFNQNKSKTSSLSPEEITYVDNLKKHHELNELNKAAFYRRKLQDALLRNALDEEQRALYQKVFNLEKDDDYKKTLEKYRQFTTPIATQAKSGGESYLQRFIQMGRFNEQSMAMMMLIEDLIFLLDLTASLTGLKMELFERANFEQLKAMPEVRTYDPEDFQMPEDSPLDTPEQKIEKNKEREAITNKLKQLEIYPIKFINNRFELLRDRGPILDPNRITFDLCAANGVVHRPDVFVCARKSVIDFCVKIIGTAPDPLYHIQNQIESSEKHSHKSAADFEAKEAHNTLLGPGGRLMPVPK
jgi:hypothetical protein